MVTRRDLLAVALALPAMSLVQGLDLAKAGPVLPTLWGDGVHDDAPALEALLNGADAMTPDGRRLNYRVASGGVDMDGQGRTYRAARTIRLTATPERPVRLRNFTNLNMSFHVEA